MSNRVLAAEYVVAIGFSSWAALKSKQLPWPPTIVRTSVAFGILYVLAQASPELASVLGAGFLMAQLIKVLENKTPYTGGVPERHDTGDSKTPNGSLPGDTKHTFGILGF
jgi:hypothetical protein